MAARWWSVRGLGVVVVISGALACGDSAPSGGPASTESSSVCGAPVSRGAAELAAPVVTFDADVAPLLAKSCSFSSCHGSRGAGNHGVFLGARGASEDAAAVKTALLAPSHALPAMPYVTPGDPERSFVMHKLDGTLCGFDAQCVGASCGSSMPVGNSLLPETARDTVRRWIAQGAR